MAGTRTLLRIAFDMEPTLKMTALDDPDRDAIYGTVKV